MASIAELVPHIYHEKQEPGSMMCAQHALNSLLQGNYFTAADLSHIASSLDEQERGFNDDTSATVTSNNMDDTGFFSVQVLVQALEVWGLDIVGWRAEAMKPYQDIPHTQLAFILNSQQHWYTLRRFGPASTHLHEDEGTGHWFSLNSLESTPQWISKTYLGMQIQQAENDGYSVFAVIQKDPEAPLALARSEADHIAAAIPDNATASGAELGGYNAPGPSGQHDLEGFEDEDLELQRALQASLMGASDVDFTNWTPNPPPLSQGTVPLPEMTFPPQSGSSGGQTPQLGQSPVNDPADESDPVAASMARSQRLLQRMTAEQRFAQRELVDEGFTPHTQAYDDDLRRAIQESEAMARGSTARQPDDEDADVDMDDFSTTTPIPRATSPPLGTFIPGGSRVYDDEDEEFQAALRASLDHVPEGWTAPPEFESHRPQATSSSISAVPVIAPSPRSVEDDTESVVSEDTPSSDTPVTAKEETVDVDEMRRRRLARFGG